MQNYNHKHHLCRYCQYRKVEFLIRHCLGSPSSQRQKMGDIEFETKRPDHNFILKLFLPKRLILLEFGPNNARSYKSLHRSYAIKEYHIPTLYFVPMVFQFWNQPPNAVLKTSFPISLIPHGDLVQVGWIAHLHGLGLAAGAGQRHLILVPVDGSKSSSRAIDVAIDLARRIM